MPDTPDSDRSPAPDDAALSRRRALRLGVAGGLSALAATGLSGCVGSVPAYYAAGPESVRPTPTRYADLPPAPASPAAPRVLAPPPAPAPASGLPVRLAVVPRAKWTSEAAGTNVKPMNGVRRITVHHSALAMGSTSAAATTEMLVSIQKGHQKRGWADIGYHFAIDRGGRVIACRDLRHQGAHVADQNEHNVGICVLGHFDQQEPTAAQIDGLHRTLTALASAHRVPMRHVYTHQEFNPTACPGGSLQQHMIRARRGLA